MVPVKKRVTEIENVVRSHSERLKLLTYRSLDSEARSRRRNLLFKGIPENKYESCFEEARRFIHVLLYALLCCCLFCKILVRLLLLLLPFPFTFTILYTVISSYFYHVSVHVFCILPLLLLSFSHVVQYAITTVTYLPPVVLIGMFSYVMYFDLR